jgi:hypothetical protein
VAVVQSWPVFTGFSIKIGIKKAWPDLGWPLLTGGRYLEVAVNTGLTVFWNTNTIFPSQVCCKMTILLWVRFKGSVF